MKIIIIGPVYPYKGGISHYTGLMAKSLSKTHDVQIVSFKLQYPKFLSRGKEQKNNNYSNCSFENTHYLLNTINPISYISTVHYIIKEKPNLVIFQWWHPYFTPSYWVILKILGNRIKTLLLCHNVLPHDSFPFQKVLVNLVFKNSDSFIVQSETDEKDLHAIIKLPIYKKTFLPTFDIFNNNGISKSEARSLLGLAETDNVILFFGFIREYKGLKHLICAMPYIEESIPNCKLIIAGEFFENNKEEYANLIMSQGSKNSIQLFDGYIPDNDINKYFTSCDVVVLPYESATQSAIVQIAYGFNKPVISTDVGGLSEVVIDGKTGYTIPPFDHKLLANAIIRFFKEGNKERFLINIQTEADKYTWNKMNEVVEYIYNQLTFVN